MVENIYKVLGRLVSSAATHVGSLCCKKCRFLIKGRESEVRGQRSEVRGQRSEVGSRKSEVRKTGYLDNSLKNNY